MERVFGSNLGCDTCPGVWLQPWVTCPCSHTMLASKQSSFPDTLSSLLPLNLLLFTYFSHCYTNHRAALVVIRKNHVGWKPLLLLREGKAPFLLFCQAFWLMSPPEDYRGGCPVLTPYKKWWMSWGNSTFSLMIRILIAVCISVFIQSY